MARRYGWKPDKPDDRDFLYKETHPEEQVDTLPVRGNLLTDPKMPAVYDQGDENSCVANSSSSLIQYAKGLFGPSRQGLYWYARQVDGDTADDDGTTNRSAMKVLASMGVGLETAWPYSMPFQVKPNAAYAADAPLYRSRVYSRLLTGWDFKTCINAGFPFIIGFTCYPEIESENAAATGFVDWWKEGEQPVGGHSVLVGAWDNDFQQPGILQGRRVYGCRNSWSADWGQGGNFWIPQSYLENTKFAQDAWTIRA